MSVYTSVNAEQLDAFLSHYEIGDLVHHAGIRAGITNSNYALQTSDGEYILTLYEHHGDAVLDYILGLQHHLASRGVACAAPVRDGDGRFYSPLQGKPAAIIERVPGEVCPTPGAQHCELIGAELARFHLAGADYGARRNNPCGLDWYVAMAEKLAPVMSERDRHLLDGEVKLYLSYPFTELPQGAIHADLFHDNALFDGEKLGGIIDFDYACFGTLIYDLAVVINDWCLLTDSRLDSPRVDALLQAYDQVRPLQDREHQALPLMLRVGALRFWLSRLRDQKFPLPGELTFIKDPDRFRDMLLLRREIGPDGLFSDTELGKDTAE